MGIVVSVAVSFMVLYFVSLVTKRFGETLVVNRGCGLEPSSGIIDKSAGFLKRYLMLGGVLDSSDQIKTAMHGRRVVIAATGCGVCIPLISGYSFSTALISMAVSTLVGIGLVMCWLESQRRAFRSDLLYDFPFFAQQLILVSLSGDTLETGFRKISLVSQARRRFGAIELLIQKALRQREGDARVEDVILKIADQVGAPELRRAIQGKVESDRYGSAISHLLRDLSHQSKISAIKVTYFELPAMLRQKRPERKRESEITWRLILLLSQNLASNLDVITSLRRSSEILDTEHALREDLRRLEQALKEGVPEEQCIASFAQGYQTLGIDLLVQALLLSKRSPGKLREMVDEILAYLKEEGRGG